MISALLLVSGLIRQVSSFFVLVPPMSSVCSGAPCYMELISVVLLLLLGLSVVHPT